MTELNAHRRGSQLSGAFVPFDDGAEFAEALSTVTAMVAARSEQLSRARVAEIMHSAGGRVIIRGVEVMRA